MTNEWKETLDLGDVLLIDGGMGTELQRRGVAMDEVAWSGAAVFTNPDAVRETHEDYIRAGARVIITNTFGSTRQMLEPAGYGDQVEAVHRDAVKLAKQARENVGEPTVAIAGSISTEPPSFDRDAFLSPEKELAAYREASVCNGYASLGVASQTIGKVPRRPWFTTVTVKQTVLALP